MINAFQEFLATATIPKKVVIFCAAVGVFLFFSVFPADDAFAAAPQLTELKWKNGQNKIGLIFDQPLYTATGSIGAVTSTDFALTGASSSAYTLSPDTFPEPGDRVISLTISPNLNVTSSGQLSIACAASQIWNNANEACVTGSSTIQFTPGTEDTAAPVIRNVVLQNTGSILVFANEDLRFSGVSGVTSTYVISTENSGDSEVQTQLPGIICDPPSACRNRQIVNISATGAVITFAPGDTLQIGADFKDIVGNAIATTTHRITPNLKISEVRRGKTGNELNEFVELYNTGDMALNLSPGGTNWSTGPIDTTGEIGSGPMQIIAVDAQTLYASYYDNTNGNLKFAKSLDSGSSWTTVVVDNGGANDVGSYSALQSIGTSTIFIAYFDFTALDLKFAKSTNGGTAWTTSTIDSAGDQGRDLSLYASDASNFYISYYDNTGATSLRFARSNNGGAAWTTSTLDSAGVVMGQNTSVHGIGTSTIIVSYRNHGNGDLKFAKSTDGGAVFSTTTIDAAGNIYGQTSIRAVNANTYFISYYESDGLDLRFAKTVNGGASWTTSTIDSQGSVGQYTSLVAIDASTIFITYLDAANNNLKFAKSVNGGTTWTFYTLDNIGDVGRYTSLYAYDASTYFVIYQDFTNGDLKLARTSPQRIFLHLADASSTASHKALTVNRSVLQPRSFYLFTPESGYSDITSPDATYNPVGTTLATSSGVTISLSPIAADAQGIIDRLGWGTQGLVEGSSSPQLGLNNSLERKARSTSNADSMFDSGSGDSDISDVFGGNGYDTDNNAANFVTQTTSTPQNSLSASEFPSGGPQGDTGPPYVQFSFPGPNDSNIPRDIPSIGFGFNEPVDNLTITSSTVLLRKVGPDGQAETGDDISVSGTVVINDPNDFTKPPYEFRAALEGGTTYVFKVLGGATSSCTTCVKDFAGQALNQSGRLVNGQGATSTDGISFRVVFSVGSGTITPTFPPFVEGTMPFPGSVVPPNISKVGIKFTAKIASSSANSGTINLSKLNTDGTKIAVTTSNFTLPLAFNDEVVQFDATFASSSRYEIGVTTGVKSKDNIFLGSPFFASFETLASNDATPPKVVASIPAAGATNLQRTKTKIIAHSDDDLDPATIFGTTNVVLKDAGPDNVFAATSTDDIEFPGIFEYDFFNKDVFFVATNPFVLGRNYRLTIKSGASGVKNIVGLQFDGDGNGTAGDDYNLNFTVESANTDTAGPAVVFARAHDFGAAVTFSEPVPTGEVTLFSKYSFESPSGTPVVLSAIGGQRIDYDEVDNTIFVENLKLVPGNSFKLIISPLPDLIGNLSATSTFNGTVEQASFFGGELDPGAGSVMGPMTPPPGGTIGFIPSAHVFPFSMLPNATTTYGVELPISKQIPSGGRIELTFPSGFGIGGAKKEPQSPTNNDLNGPGPGTPAFSTSTEASGGASDDGVTIDTVSNVVKITLAGTTRSESGDQHDFIHLDIAGIKNTAIPRDFNTGGYTVGMKTYDASGTLLESVGAEAFFILAGGNFTLRGQITNASSGAAINDARLVVFSPMTGPAPLVTANLTFGTSSDDGRYSADSLVGGDYFVVTEPFFTVGGADYVGSSFPTPVRVDSASCVSNICTRNFTVTPVSSTAAVGIAVKLTHATNTFSASEELDVLAGGPANFSVRTVTPGAGSRSASDPAITTLYLNQNGRWFVGVGPAMPKGLSFFFAGPPTPPNWIMPQPLDIEVSGCPSACAVTIATATFNIRVADKTVTGQVVNGSGLGIGGAEVYAYSPIEKMGTRAQTGSDGSFSLRAIEGMFLAGVFVPGMPSGNEISVRIDSAGQLFIGSDPTPKANIVIKVVKPDFSISGKAVDDSSNVVQGASIYAYRTDGLGHTEAYTDASGLYTLYVGNGTWNVGAFIPGFGSLPERTVVVSGANATGINFSPTTAGVTFRSISGTVCRDNNGNSSCDAGEEFSNVNVYAEALISSVYRFNDALTNASGSYTLKVPANTGASDTYTIRSFSPTVGELGKITVDVSSTDATGRNIVAGAPNTITFNFSTTTTKLFVDVFDPSTNRGNVFEAQNVTSTSLQVPSSTSYILKLSLDGMNIPKENATGTGYASSTAALDASVNRTITVTLPTLVTISGTTYRDSTSNTLSDVWVEVMSTSTRYRVGAKSTSTGAFSLRAPAGDYTIVGSKPGYIGKPTAISVGAGGSSGAQLILYEATLSVSGLVYRDANSNSTFDSGEAVANAMVRAVDSDSSFVTTAADINGAYSLKLTSVAGTWTISALADSYGQGTAGPYAGNAPPSTLNINLGSTISTNKPLTKSMTPSAGGVHSDTNSGVEMVFPANALGTSQNSAQITIKETANIPITGTANPVGSTGIEIDAVDANGSPITTLSGASTLKITKTKQQMSDSGDFGSLAALGTIDEVALTYFDESTQSWVSAPTSIDVLIKNNSGDAFVSVDPATFASNMSSGLDNPNATGTNTGIDYYADFQITYKGSFEHLTRFAIVGAAVATPSAASTGSSGGGGTPSSPSPSSQPSSEPVTSVTPLPSSTQLAVAPPPPPPSTVTPPPPAPVTALPPAVVVPPPAVALPPVLAKSLKLGDSGDTVKTLQQFLKDEGVYPEGLVTGYFGLLTKAAVIRFQEKYASEVLVPAGLTKGTGFVGSSTRAKINALAKLKALAEKKPEVPRLKLAVSRLEKNLALGAKGDDVKALQQLLKDEGVYPEGLVTGYFGLLTKAAVIRFQEKYASEILAPNGLTSGNGFIGPSTRTKLNSLIK